MSLRLDHIDAQFVHILDQIVERIILHPEITRQQEKDLRRLRDDLQVKQYPLHEMMTMLLDFERGIGDAQ